MINLNALVRPNILALEPYSSARDEFQGTAGIYLDANENPYGTLGRYPDPHHTKLRQQIGKVKNIQPANIFTGNGSDEIIDLCFRIFCEPGRDKALIFTPTYGMYEVAAGINNVEMVKLSLDVDFQIAETSFLEKAADAALKMVIVCSPNNPTGNTISGIEFVLNNFEGIVVVDEAYIDFSAKASLLGMLGRYPNLIIIQTLSKAWSLASARIGMAFAQEAIIGLMDKVKYPYNISLANQELAMQALANQAVFRKRLNTICYERERMAIALQDIPFVEKIYPSDANFLLVKLKDAAAVYSWLAAKGIVVRDRSRAAEGCLRITVGTPEENTILINTLKQYAL